MLRKSGMLRYVLPSMTILMLLLNENYYNHRTQIS